MHTFCPFAIVSSFTSQLIESEEFMGIIFSEFFHIQNCTYITLIPEKQFTEYKILESHVLEDLEFFEDIILLTSTQGYEEI